MLLKRVEIHNFGPYNGRTLVDLRVSDASPIVLVHGENERGKTSLANAIRWCLYGRARGRRGRDLSTVSLMNWEAMDAGTFNMSIKLAFEHQNSEYLLTRHVQATHRPTRETDLERILTLEIDGTVQPTERVKEIISGILHEDISRFFFFDGEMLNEYEDLLNDPDRAPTIVRRSIEQILGLPALERAAKDLEDLRTQAERKQLQETRRNKENEKLIRDAQQKEEELAAILRDIEQNEGMKERLEQQRASLRDDRDRFTEIQVEVRLLDEKEAELRELERNIEFKRAACRTLLQQAWWMPLEAQLHRQYEEAELAEREDRERIREITKVRHQADGIQQIVERGSCGVCGQVVDPSRAAELQSRLDRLRESLTSLEARDRDQRSAREIMLLLRPFVGKAALKDLFDTEVDIRRLRMRQARIGRQIDEIKQRVRQHERSEIQRIEREYDECVAQLKDVGRNLERLDTQRSAVHGALERLRQRIRSLPEADKRLATEATVLGALETLFERGIQAFREEVRRDVEVEATRIHQMLTKEEGYDHLRITPQYGLVLVNREGRTIHQRSAGSEQVLALSLIGALNRCATREAPVVMDTPFGRLDVGHRANILKFAPSFGRQVVLLVQSGEFDRERDMEYLAGKVSSELRIQRDGASDRSIIEPVRDR